MKHLVSIVTPNFNGLEHLKECIPSLLKQTYKNIEIIVVDNGSTDESLKYLVEKFPKVFVIRLKINYGFSIAVNKGVKKSKGRYILVLNNDTKVERRCVEFLVQSARVHSEAGFISAKILQFDNIDKIDNAGDYVDSSGHLLTRGFGKSEKLFNRGDYIFLGTGSGTLFKKEVFTIIGSFDEDFFFYMEDADFCFRAQIAGFKGWFEPKAKIYHKRMGTSKKYIKNFEALVFRNMTVMLIKNFPKSLFLYHFNWLKIILVHINTLRYLLFKGKLLDIIRVEFYLLIHIQDLFKKRRMVQDLKVVSDSYIISQIKDKKIKVGKLLF
ncbi:hypothetical protein A3F00_04185 [Candidatus Daviesbacteria bacterium RIFCSPHIGHO2_12_FULL_37_11]|uniref:Glycosyltransferase 2-like domain-containing protein n=1 Tax=Candidatus Daviesbacteria bacterium RIFCSPHIGHO2_12_FULL_37_11 TaxID=1797777 RepID=A0A1F5KEP7_9BACT|nr:MAG: hypothetical protein A2111_00585 [Candidatus Daviesbacteria bacterium GWA1_38_6]OGE18125.1 MAG: hypothetical protein A2769_02660 [Candidatus Daviesbacteria bacterium RIFCSPHIGHO2_01_FULL_37_27]OGE39255.1 MAG: hypothetical protein A3F00_04185 [Candidatus Daviesbacteria bacterium RIFCSPHIGHO2_12_FULL_37_11]OGE45627.1 MAG: hypothetical protein A3B39_00535 [Candidatus Daviesbacteria bacterium RIFCSPLOWO2_01_FULL_37_10]